MRKLCLVVSLSCALVAPAHAELRISEVNYEVNGTSFTGYLAYDDSVSGERPGVLVVHEWWGHNAFARGQAEKLARAGYTAFALDMYGSGKVADHPDTAGRFSKEATAKFQQVVDRFNKAREILADHETVNPKHIAAQGYCFGGAVVLNMARSGADLDGVVSYHGSLGGLVPAEAGAVDARVLVYTGGADNFVPPDQVAGFVKEMQEAGADLTLVSFPGVKHSFMNPGADDYAEEFGMPIAYDAEAAGRAWQGTLEFYRAIFAQ
ncbi:MAG: dienelactone hydrolase family protein [Halofilum sp. (in: g-proteobacteria)]|nr:dienelactone hydrolase family protein [Halofilum sp. (in: g-proteobacteria)]